MMLKTMLLSLALLPTTVLASTATQRHHTKLLDEPSACDGLAQDACTENDDCRWDEVDNRCEPVANTGACYTLDQDQCSADQGCRWDAVDDRCEPAKK